MGQQEFRARSGRVVKVQENGAIVFDHVNGYITPEMVMDAEEFFQAKRDAELGRWRWPESPDYVVYRDTSGDAIVFREQMPAGGILYRRGDDVVDLESEAAHAYFEAHPERKPWEDAKTGEVWLITKGDTDGEFAAVVSDPAVTGTKEFDAAAIAFEVDDRRITAGRRIWPEDAS